MSEVVTIVVAVLSSGALTALVNGLIAYRQSKRGVTAGVRMLLYDRIKHLGKGYIARGSITSEELEDLVQLHEVYHKDLDGNGFLDAIMNNVKSLPITGGNKK